MNKHIYSITVSSFQQQHIDWQVSLLLLSFLLNNVFSLSVTFCGFIIFLGGMSCFNVKDCINHFKKKLIAFLFDIKKIRHEFSVKSVPSVRKTKATKLVKLTVALLFHSCFSSQTTPTQIIIIMIFSPPPKSKRILLVINFNTITQNLRAKSEMEFLLMNSC